MLTETQKLARRGKLGSSQAAAILGLDPYASAADVWLTLTGQADDFEGNEATERGNLLEPVLLKYAEQELKKLTFRDVMTTHPSGLLVANLDGAIMEGADKITEIIEAKTSNNPDEWGQEGTDEVPNRVVVQAHHQFACVPTATVCWVPVLLPGFKKFDFRMYRIERNPELVMHVENAGIDFMCNFVQPRRRPDDYLPSLDVLKRVKRLPGLVVEVGDELVAQYVAAKDAAKIANDLKEEAQRQLVAALGDAEGATYSGGSLSYMLVKRKGFEVAATEFRQLKVKAEKKAPAKQLETAQA